MPNRLDTWTDEDRITTALESMSTAAHHLEAAEKFVRETACCEERAGNYVVARKLIGHADSIATRKRQTRHAQHQLAEAIGINTNPDCICGQSSRCELEGHN